MKDVVKTGKYRIALKEMPQSQRPRERLLKVGAENLTDAELLAIILRTGTVEESALELSNRLVSSHGGLRFLAEATIEELIAGFKGVGLAKAAQIKALVELGRRVALGSAQDRPSILSPGDVVRLLMSEMRFLDREVFKVLSLNTKHQVLAMDTISIGGLDFSLAHPREVFKDSLKRSAAAVILVHNHPSGDPTPSKEDIQVTKRMLEAGVILGIEVLDHVVLGDNRYRSLKEDGII